MIARRLTPEDIAKINSECPDGQGVFFEAQSVPIKYKGQYTIYSSWNSSGSRGGSCWGTESHWYQEERPHDTWKVLDLVLEVVSPGISHRDYKYILDLVDSDDYSDVYYYGNYDDYTVEFIPLKKLYKHLGI